MILWKFIWGCYCLLFTTYLQDSTSKLSSELGEEKIPLEGFSSRGSFLNPKVMAQHSVLGGKHGKASSPLNSEPGVICRDGQERDLGNKIRQRSSDSLSLPILLVTQNKTGMI